MNYFIFMAMVDGEQQISENLCDYWFFKWLAFWLLSDKVKEVSPGAKLHNDVEKVFVFVCFIVLYYVRVVKRREDLDLSLHLFQILADFLLWNSFDGDFESGIIRRFC